METGHLTKKIKKKNPYKSETNNKLAALPKTWRDSFGLNSTP